MGEITPAYQRLSGQIARILRFAWIGAACLGMNVAIMALAVDFMGWHYLAGCASSFAVLAPTSYWLHKVVTHHDPSPPSLLRFLQYIASLVLGALINVGLVAILVDCLRLHYLLSTMLAAGSTFAANYLFQVLFVFRQVGK